MKSDDSSFAGYHVRKTAFAHYNSQIFWVISYEANSI